MAIYEYRCERDGPFEVVRAIGTAPASVACPTCAREAGRGFSSPMFSRAPRAIVAARDHEERPLTQNRELGVEKRGGDAVADEQRSGKGRHEGVDCR